MYAQKGPGRQGLRIDPLAYLCLQSTAERLDNRTSSNEKAAWDFLDHLDKLKYKNLLILRYLRGIEGIEEGRFSSPGDISLKQSHPILSSSIWDT